jgi:hypothetical protein
MTVTDLNILAFDSANKREDFLHELEKIKKQKYLCDSMETPNSQKTRDKIKTHEENFRNVNKRQKISLKYSRLTNYFICFKFKI